MKLCKRKTQIYKIRLYCGRFVVCKEYFQMLPKLIALIKLLLNTVQYLKDAEE